MNSFEKEFYRSPWQRVLPVGPDGIQPYLRLERASVARRQHRLAPTLRALAQGLSSFVQGLGAFGSFGRWGAGNAALAHGTRSEGRLPLALPRRAAPIPSAQRCLRRAA